MLSRRLTQSHCVWVDYVKKLHETLLSMTSSLRFVQRHSPIYDVCWLKSFATVGTNSNFSRWSIEFCVNFHKSLHDYDHSYRLLSTLQRFWSNVANTLLVCIVLFFFLFSFFASNNTQFSRTTITKRYLSQNIRLTSATYIENVRTNFDAKIVH